MPTALAFPRAVCPPVTQAEDLLQRSQRAAESPDHRIGARGHLPGTWKRQRLDVPRYVGAREIPPMHWKACHPATIRRFKAEFSCPNGHGIVLKGHSIDADGTVHASVVCPWPACDFHDFVRLSRWDAGPV